MLRDAINNAVKDAMRAKNERALSTLRMLLSTSRTRLVSRISGGCMIGGGIWLALTRAR